MLLFYIIWLSADNEYLWVYNDLRYVDNDFISLNSDWRALPVGLQSNRHSVANSFREQLVLVSERLAVAIDRGSD